MKVDMLVLENLTKTYRTPAGQVRALDEVSLEIGKGEFVAVCGPSGSGKTTLLMMIAAMLRPTSGAVRFEERAIYEMTGPARAQFRAKNIGFVFQMFHLVPYLNILENVLLAAAVVHRRDGKAQARSLLERLGLQQRLGHRPSELSAGEKQRTAIARALLNQPKLILADEPTGNLDSATGSEIIELLSSFNRRRGVTIISATHDHKMLANSDRVLRIRDGKVDRIDRRIAAGRQQQADLAFGARKPARKMVDNLPFLQPGRGRLLLRRGKKSGMGQPAAFFRLAGQVVQAVGQERFRHVSVLLPACRPGSSGKAGAPPGRAG